EVEADALARAERARATVQDADERGEARAGGPRVVGDDDVAATDLVPFDAGEGEGGALAGGDGGGVAAVDLGAADAGAEVAGQNADRGVRAEAAAPHGAGDDGAGAADGEDAVDGETEEVVVGALRDGGGGVGECGGEALEAGAGAGGDGDERCIGEGRAREGGADIVEDEVEPFGLDEVDLGDGDDAVADAEQVDDREVLAGLGHDALIGGDDEQDDVDAGGAREHVADEGFVARDVDDGELLPGREAQAGEAEVDGDATALLLDEAVGVDAGEGADERGLAVVDVAGRAEDEVRHQQPSSASTRKGSERSVAPSTTGRAMKRDSRAQSAAGRSRWTARP